MRRKTNLLALLFMLLLLLACWVLPVMAADGSTATGLDVLTCSLYGVGGITLVTAIVGMGKKVGLPTKYAPALSIVAGLIIGIAYGITQGLGVGVGVVAGIMLGSVSSGVYDAGKSLGK